MCRTMTFNCGKDQKLIRSYSRGRTTEIPGHRTMRQAVSFISRMGHELTQISDKEKKRTGTRGAQEQGAIREERKKDFVGLHDFGSRKLKQSRRKTSLYYNSL